MPRAIPAATTAREAWDWVRRRLPAARIETVAAAASAGRACAEAVFSPVDLPRYRRAMMDGFALRAADLTGLPGAGGDVVPLTTAASGKTLAVVGRSRPTQPYIGPVGAGQAVAIATGAPVPDDCDAVLPIEFCDSSGGEGVVRCLASVGAGKHVGRLAEDVARDEQLFAAGRRLRPQDVALLSALGVGAVQAFAPPRVRIVVAGDEIVPAGSRPSGFHVADANGPLLAALVARDGGRPQPTGVLPDDPVRLRAALEPQSAPARSAGRGDDFDDAPVSFPPCDVILSAGGSSAGSEDFLPQLLAERGELAIRGVAIRPGGPASVGRIGETLVFLLPGQPTACLAAYDLLVGPAIRTLSGLPVGWPYRAVSVPLAAAVSSSRGRMDYVRVRLSEGLAHPLGGGASRMSSTTQADGFLLVPEDRDGLPAGETATIHLYDSASDPATAWPSE